ncbi:hypothetical protein B14911_16815 [Bacillus sp. NRRL B-14911]|nr:hypothetical protein B14911_16815 [Bacillus sp. NRRL B-14911]
MMFPHDDEKCIAEWQAVYQVTIALRSGLYTAQQISLFMREFTSIKRFYLSE